MYACGVGLSSAFPEYRLAALAKSESDFRRDRPFRKKMFAKSRGSFEPEPVREAINSGFIMAHIVTSKCLGCKFTDCVEVCPVACFYELEGQLIIHPDECIDCTACVAECPVEAIYAEGDLPVAY